MQVETITKTSTVTKESKHYKSIHTMYVTVYSENSKKIARMGSEKLKVARYHLIPDTSLVFGIKLARTLPVMVLLWGISHHLYLLHQGF